MNEYDLDAPCPHCGAPNDWHFSVSGGAPRHGDVSVCIRCRLFSVFQDTVFGLALRKPTPDELERLSKDRRVQQVQAAFMYL